MPSCIRCQLPVQKTAGPDRWLVTGLAAGPLKTHTGEVYEKVYERYSQGIRRLLSLCYAPCTSRFDLLPEAELRVPRASDIGGRHCQPPAALQVVRGACGRCPCPSVAAAPRRQ